MHSKVQNLNHDNMPFPASLAPHSPCPLADWALASLLFHGHTKSYPPPLRPLCLLLPIPETPIIVTWLIRPPSHPPFFQGNFLLLKSHVTREVIFHPFVSNSTFPVSLTIPLLCFILLHGPYHHLDYTYILVCLLPIKPSPQGSVAFVWFTAFLPDQSE